jgi:hypothetical protein
LEAENVSARLDVDLARGKAKVQGLEKELVKAKKNL